MNDVIHHVRPRSPSARSIAGPSCAVTRQHAAQRTGGAERGIEEEEEEEVTAASLIEAVILARCLYVYVAIPVGTLLVCVCSRAFVSLIR